MKNTILFIILIVVAFFGYNFLKNKNKLPVINETKQYRNSDIGISFTYPKMLTASTTDDKVILHHDIPYKNTGACDMMGENKTYDRLTDFEMTFQLVDQNLTNTVKNLSPYIPQENFVNDELVVSPGFIDQYTLEDLKGFAIYEGVEGCGQTTYYFPIKSDKTLVVTNASIQALSGSRLPEKVNEVLSTPGVISNQKNKELFESILKSLKL